MKAHRTPYTRDPRKTTPRHIIKWQRSRTRTDDYRQPEREKRLPTKEYPSGYHQTSQQKPYKPEENGMIYLIQ